MQSLTYPLPRSFTTLHKDDLLDRCHLHGLFDFDNSRAPTKAILMQALRSHWKEQVELARHCGDNTDGTAADVPDTREVAAAGSGGQGSTLVLHLPSAGEVTGSGSGSQHSTLLLRLEWLESKAEEFMQEAKEIREQLGLLSGQL